MLLSCGCQISKGRLVRDNNTWREIICDELKDLLLNAENRQTVIDNHVKSTNVVALNFQDAIVEKIENIAMISGPLEITHEQFIKHYVPSLQEAVSKDHHFVVGNAIGADLMSIQWLLDNGMKTRLTVYLFPKRKRHLEQDELEDMGVYQFKYDKKWKSFTNRDEAMTKISDYDIAWERNKDETKALFGESYRSGRVSGVTKNLLRRIEKNK